MKAHEMHARTYQRREEGGGEKDTHTHTQREREREREKEKRIVITSGE